jgi:holo-[acyl-carrier protein] synthase
MNKTFPGSKVGGRFEIGMDLIEVRRVAQAMERHPEGFGKRVFTEAENVYCGKQKNASMHYAGRFAAKEAVLKSLGIGLRGGVHWTDVEVTNDVLGKPEVTLKGKALSIAQEKKAQQLEVSITHCRGFASAVAILVRGS